MWSAVATLDWKMRHSLASILAASAGCSSASLNMRRERQPCLQSLTMAWKVCNRYDVDLSTRCLFGWLVRSKIGVEMTMGVDETGHDQ